VIAIAAIFAVGSTSALGDISRVERARRAYDELRFGDVLPEIAAARRAGPLGRDDDIELTRLEAYTYSVFEDSVHAIEAFRRLIALDPGFEPRGASPKIRAYYDQARQPSTPVATVTATAAPAPGPAGHRSMLRSPWVWGGAAAVIAVAGASVWLALSRDEPRTGNLGALTLP